MRFYAIRRISTGWFLPQPVNKTGMRSSSHREPSDKYPPRLFVKKQYAQLSLNMWLEGKWGFTIVD